MTMLDADGCCTPTIGGRRNTSGAARGSRRSSNDVLRNLLHRAQASGPLVTDAALEALAIEHGATLCTTDRDFTRLPDLRTVNPLDG